MKILARCKVSTSIRSKSQCFVIVILGVLIVLYDNTTVNIPLTNCSCKRVGCKVGLKMQIHIKHMLVCILIFVDFH